MNPHPNLRKIITALFLMLLFACGNKTADIEPAPFWFDAYSSFKMDDYQQYFNQELMTLAPDFVPYGNYIILYYQMENNQLLWTNNGLQEHKIDTLFSFISNAYQHGLPEARFKKNQIDSVVNLLKTHRIENDAPTLYKTLFHLEMDLTAMYFDYASALSFGATDPKKVNGVKWLYATKQVDTSFVANLRNQWHNMNESLKSMAPVDSNYLVLQAEFLRLYPYRDSTLTNIPNNPQSYLHNDDAIKQLCSRLQLLGILDTSYVPTEILSDTIMTAVNLFRANNAIPESATIDEETIEKLNRPISYYTDKLAVNMERLRWRIIPQKGENFIAVNIPDFTLRTYRENVSVFTTNICCGKTQNPNVKPEERHSGKLILAFESETPLLYSTIKRIVLNPEWNIPYSILRDEYYPKFVKSNTAVVKKEDLYIVDKKTGKYMVPDSIQWSKINRKNIPYKIFQSSGKHNALGQIKFDFPNTESVYLHDTNNKGAFKRRVRALSHGCVRVQNPFELAAVLYEMNDYDSLRCEELSIIVGKEPVSDKGKEYLEKREEQETKYYESLSAEKKRFYRSLRPTSVYLEKTMPVYIEYYTAYVGDNGMVQYRNDIYYKDENIIYLLNNQ